MDVNHTVVVHVSNLCVSVGCPGNASAQLVWNAAVVYSFDAPVVGSYFPSHGPVDGSAVVMFLGTSFGTTAAVTLVPPGADSANVSVPVLRQDHSTIVALPPAGVGIDFDVIITVGEQSVTLPRGWSYDPPELYSITPIDRPLSTLLPCNSHPCVNNWVPATGTDLALAGRNLAYGSGVDAFTVSVSVGNMTCAAPTGTVDIIASSARCLSSRPCPMLQCVS